MSKMSRKERREQRRAAARRDRDSRDEGGFLTRKGFVKSEDELEGIGLGGVYTPESGKDGEEKVNRVHLLPGHEDDPNLIALRLYGHERIGADGHHFLCPKVMREYLEREGIAVPEEIEDGRCPICERHAQLLEHYRKTKDSLNEDDRLALWGQLKALSPYSGRWNEPKAKRMLTWTVDASSEDTEDEGVKIWLMPTSTVYEQGLLEAMEDADHTDEDGEPELRDPLDPEEGYVLRFKRSGKGRDTKYTGIKLQKRGWSIEEDHPEWLEAVPRYLDVLRFPTYDEMAAALESSGGEDTEDEKPKEDRDRRPPKRERQKPEEGGDGPNPHNDDDEPEGEPKRRRRREPDPDDDDDEPEDRPRRRARRDDAEGPDTKSKAEVIRERLKQRKREREREEDGDE